MRTDAGDEILKEHLMISKTLQKQFVKITRKVKKVKFFALLCDETANVSSQKQLPICVCYFDQEKAVVREDFVTNIRTTSATGANTRVTIEAFLEENGLPYAISSSF